MKEYYIQINKELKQLSNILEDEVTIHLSSGLYFTEGTESDCFIMNFKKLTLIGEDNTVLYDNRGHMLNCFPKVGNASSFAHTILFMGIELTLINITFVNGCNIDYKYDSLVLNKQYEVITQAYAIGVYDVKRFEAYNCKFISMLDTCSFKDVKDVYMEDCYMMGTNDFIAIGDKTYYRNCSFDILGACPMWSTGKTHLIFDKCLFNVNISEGSTLYFTKRGGDIILISSKFNANVNHFQLEIKKRRESRYYLYDNTYNNNSLEVDCYKESIVFLNKEEALFIENNPNYDYSIKINGNDTLETEAYFSTKNDFSEIICSDNLECTRKNTAILTKNKLIGKDREGFIKIKRNFLEAIIYFKMIGHKTKLPIVIRDLTYSIGKSEITFDYLVDGEDESIIDCYQDGKLIYKNVSRKIPLLPSDIGKGFTIEFTPKNSESVLGKKETIITEKIDESHLSSSIVFEEMNSLALSDENHLYMDTIEAKYLGYEIPNVASFECGPKKSFYYGEGTDGALGVYGLIPCSRGSALVYPVSELVTEYSLEINLTPEKVSGEGFGSANGQYLEVWLNYDQNGNGVALRIERIKSSDKGCMFSLRKYVNYYNELISEEVFSDAYSKDTIIRAELQNGILAFTCKKVFLQTNIERISTSFMLRSTGTIGIGNRFVLTKIILNNKKTAE